MTSKWPTQAERGMIIMALKIAFHVSLKSFSKPHISWLLFSHNGSTKGPFKKMPFPLCLIKDFHLFSFSLDVEKCPIFHDSIYPSAINFLLIDVTPEVLEVKKIFY